MLRATLTPPNMRTESSTERPPPGNGFSTNHDTILVYALSGPREWKTSRNLLVKDTARLLNRDNDPRGRGRTRRSRPPATGAQQYDIVTPPKQVLCPPRGRSWYATEPTYRSLLADGRIWFPKGGTGHPASSCSPTSFAASYRSRSGGRRTPARMTTPSGT
jgi:hypothetical protein